MLRALLYPVLHVMFKNIWVLLCRAGHGARQSCRQPFEKMYTILTLCLYEFYKN